MLKLKYVVLCVGVFLGLSVGYGASKVYVTNDSNAPASVQIQWCKEGYGHTCYVSDLGKTVTLYPGESYPFEKEDNSSNINWGILLNGGFHSLDENQTESVEFSPKGLFQTSYDHGFSPSSQRVKATDHDKNTPIKNTRVV